MIKLWVNRSKKQEHRRTIREWTAANRPDGFLFLDMLACFVIAYAVFYFPIFAFALAGEMPPASIAVIKIGFHYMQFR
jgi:hypothetical protein